jgi:hypothetical protein
MAHWEPYGSGLLYFRPRGSQLLGVSARSGDGRLAGKLRDARFGERQRRKRRAERRMPEREPQQGSNLAGMCGGPGGI